MIQEAKKPSEREGCLYLIERLSVYLQRGFEPYAIYFIPFLISCFPVTQNQQH